MTDTQKSTALVPSVRELDRLTIQRWVVQLPLKGTELGVSVDYLEAMARRHGLTVDQLQTLAEVRQEFSASFWKMNVLLGKGFSVERVVAVYEARGYLTPAVKVEDAVHAPSIDKIILLMNRFPEVDAEDAGETLQVVFAKIQEFFPWVKYYDLAVIIACEVANSYELHSLEAVYETLEEGQRWDSLMSEGVLGVE